MPLLFYPALLTCCGYALARGGPPERLCAILFLVGTALSVWLTPPLGQRFAHLELGIFLVDVLVLIGFVALAVGSQRYWPMWMSSMQLVAVMSHSTSVLISQPLPWAYSVAIQFWGYPMLIMMAWGAARHRERLRRFDWDPSWIDRKRLMP
jgi:hypothetical protein